MANVNTTKNIQSAEVTEKELQAQIVKAAAALKEAKKVKVSIPSVLEKNIGKTLPLAINGAVIVLPVDGKEYEIPAPYGALLKDYLEALKN